MFQIAVLRVCLAALAVLLAASALVGLRRAGSQLLRRLKPIALAALLPMAALLTDLAGEKNTNMPLRVIQPVASQVFSSCGAVTNADWLAHGACDAWFRIPATNWWARTADGWLDGVTVFAWCEFRPDIRTTNAYPRPFPQKLSLAPMANWHLLTNHEALATSHESLFWHGVTESNTLVMTWQDGLYARCATNLASFQAELFNDGSVAYRYDGSPVATNDFVVPLELPFDRDGDGLENSVDPEPDVAGPDAHGTNAEWYNTVCSNVLAAVEGGGGHGVYALTWREGVNSNAYYFVDVVAERGPAPIRFTGDRTSRLGDPAIVALAGETNRVPLLIGVDYAVTSDTPFSVSFPVDYMYPVVETNEPCVARIHWPLEFHFVETNVTGTARIYRVDVTPLDPGGTFSWETRGGGSSGGMPLRGGGCECVSFIGRDVSFCCSVNCACSGSCGARGTYDFECASFPVSGGECRCGFDDPLPGDSPSPEQPSFSVSFSDAAVIFEDTYEDTPGVDMPKRSTRVWVTVSATGGTHGGSFTLVTENLDKLTPVACESMAFPPSMAVGPYGTYCASFLCEGASQSGSAGDVKISGTFVENETGASFSSSNRLTVVKVEIKEDEIAIGNPCVHRHRYGIGEEVHCSQKPSIPSILWGTTGNGSFSGGSETLFLCPLRAEESQLRARCSDTVLPIPISVIEPEAIVCDYAEFLPPVAGGNGCGMLLRLLVVPFTVSFRNLKIQEVPADLGNWQQWGSHDGYFSDYAFYQYWCHSTFWGAGVWRSVDEFCSLGFDESRMLNWPQPWSEGRLSWKIPYGWKHKDSTSSVCVGQIEPPTYSTWTMRTNFVEKVKHDRRIGVSLSGQMFFEGVLQNGNQ